MCIERQGGKPEGAELLKEGKIEGTDLRTRFPQHIILESAGGKGRRRANRFLRRKEGLRQREFLQFRFGKKSLQAGGASTKGNFL